MTDLRDIGDAIAGILTASFDAGEQLAYAEAMAAMPPEWWQVAYPGGPPVGPSKLIRPLYFPGNPSAQPPSSNGPDCLAVKRALWRGGRWAGPSSRFDNTYSRGFALGVGPNVVDTGMAGFQRQMGFQATGQMGDDTYQALRYARVPTGLPNAGQPLFDATAVELLNQAANPPKPPADPAGAIADYCRRCIDNEPAWHYQQVRPIAVFGVKPEAGGTTDCSGHSTAAYYWAKAPDPNHRNFDGYGYTGTLIDNPRVSSPYQVGDLALYGPSSSATQHVVTCYLAGDASSSRWCSHGSEGAPVSVTLRYRGDLLCVVRPGLS